MGSIVLYIIEWAFALLVLLGIYKAAFSGTTLFRFNRLYLLGATLLSALLPLVHVTIPDSTPLVNNLSIEETEFAQELSGTFTFIMSEPEPELFITDAPALPQKKTSLWAIMLIGSYTVYVVILVIGWSRGILRARKFLRDRNRRRLSRTVWLVTHDEPYGPFSWMNYIVISDTEKGFARRASLRHEYSHVKLLHSADLVFLLACTTVNPVCWLVLQEIKIVHEFEADDQVITRYGIHEQDYQRLLIMKTVGAEAYALASSFNLNIKKRIIMMNKKKTLKRRLMWLLLLIPLLGMTSVLFARTEKAVNLDDKLRFTQSNVEMSFRLPEPMISYNSSGSSVSSVSPRTIPPPPAAVTRAEYIRVIRDDEEITEELLSAAARNDEMLIRQRNVMTIQINKRNEIYVKSGIMARTVTIDELKDLAKQFIQNPDNDPKLPVIEDYDIDGYGTVKTTVRHVFSLQYDRATSSAVWSDVRYELMKAYNELRNEVCVSKFGKDYEQCTDSEQRFARAMYANKISEAQPKEYNAQGELIKKEVKSAAGNYVVKDDKVNKDLRIRVTNSPVRLYVSTVMFDNENGQDHFKSETTPVQISLEGLDDYIDQAISDGMKFRKVRLAIQPDVPMGPIIDLKETLRNRMLLSIVQEGYKDPAGVAQSGLSMVPDIDEDEDLEFRTLSRVIRPDNTDSDNHIRTCIYLFDIKNLNDDKGNADVFNYGILSLLKLYEGQTSGKLNTPQMKTLADAYESAKNELLALQKKYSDELDVMRNNMKDQEDYEKVQQKLKEQQAELGKRSGELVNGMTGKYKNALKSIAGNYQYVCISQYKGEPSSATWSDQIVDAYLKDLSTGKIDGFAIPYTPFDYGLIQTKLSMNYSNKAVLYLD